MREIILFDTEASHLNLLPLTYTRSAADLRVGITTLREKWELLLDAKARYLTVEHLREHYADEYVNPEDDVESLFIGADVIADENLAEAVRGLESGCALLDENEKVFALRGKNSQLSGQTWNKSSIIRGVRRIEFVYDVFLRNGEVICEDFARITRGRVSQPLSETNRVIGNYMLDSGIPAIFIEEGASVEGACINVKDGPVFIGRDAEIMEGSCVRGPLALCDKAKIRMGAKIYGKTTLGPYCKVGGEVDNVVLIGYSNKAHDGYLGNAVIGEWCNIGAGVNASNLKNNYAKIRVWNYAARSFLRTDLQFCGLIMGDHSKVGINGSFNTATVVGVGVNMHGSGFPRVFVPSFSEGSPTGGYSNVRLKDFYDIAERVMSRRGKEFTPADHRMFERIYDMALQFKGGRK